MEAGELLSYVLSARRLLRTQGKKKGLTVMNWKTKPSFPNSHTYSFISFFPNPAFSQLKLGLKLYANH